MDAGGEREGFLLFHEPLLDVLLTAKGSGSEKHYFRDKQAHYRQAWLCLCYPVLAVPVLAVYRIHALHPAQLHGKAPGMQKNASSSWILKKTLHVPSERMSGLHCSSMTANGFSCQESWLGSSPFSDPPTSSLQIFQADTLAPPVALGLCWCWPSSFSLFHELSP